MGWGCTLRMVSAFSLIVVSSPNTPIQYFKKTKDPLRLFYCSLKSAIVIKFYN